MSERILYLEGSSGISGDMTVSALLDLGASRERLEEELKKLPLDGYRLVIGRTEKCGIDACAFFVELDASRPQPMRNYRQIRSMIQEAGLSEGVRRRALDIFHVLACAEARVHGTTPEQVHFHEVGAVDSIIDIVGAAVCLEDLDAKQIAVGTLREGQGTVWCQHGRMPVPVPATAELISSHGLSVRFTDTQGEMITPTGAAIAAACGNCRLPERFSIEKIGIGSGEKDFPHANILRAMWILPEAEKEQLEDGCQGDTVWVLESNVDDCPGEQLGFAQERLMEAGALDACFLPAFMKKSRPAYLLQVICRKEDIQRLENVIFRQTTTIGIRRYPAQRTVLERSMERTDTPYGSIGVKVCRIGREERAYPEYEDVRARSLEYDVPYRTVYDRAVRCWEESRNREETAEDAGRAREDPGRT